MDQQPKPILEHHQRAIFTLKLDGYDGPMDALLDLAREQKVDLLKISIATLVDQYVDFVETAKALEIYLSAEYLVMASWLTWLKSELLLPKQTTEELDEDPHLAAENLAFQLKRLDTIRKLAAGLTQQPKLGYERHACGKQYHQRFLAQDIWQADLSALIHAWVSLQQYLQHKKVTLEQSEIWSPHDGIRFFYQLLAKLSRKKDQKWHHIFQHLPEHYHTKGTTQLQKQGILASTFMACLVAAGQGKIMLQQGEPFGDIHFQLTNNKEET